MQILVFGATGQTGQHFVRLALAAGHSVRAVARTPSKLTTTHADLDVVEGSVAGPLDLDALLDGVDAVVSMLGDRQAQETRMVYTEFVRRLVPAMRQQGVRRFLYQAGGLSAKPGKRLPIPLRMVRRTIAKSFDGQHRDNEAVMQYLDAEARDLQWVVHRAGIGSDGPSKGRLRRSSWWISIGTFVDCAEYSLRLLDDDDAVHTCDGSAYARGRRS
ncbi:NAD(P)-dependent oxidoreductase [Curtobacterium sp. SP.BCp]|uniref:NAD(P)-dependent oxidoreductase n=1 Tax=Curtobacterium sp. SP.BCp TaxID=3435230 RepID=UPI003F73DA0B